jgi:hypothetical protein
MTSDMVKKELEKLTENFPKLTTPPDFSLEEYFKNLEQIIKKYISRPENDVLTYDVLDTPKSKKNKLLALKEKQRQMKIGDIWQEAIGNYKDFINLGRGHETGLDILSNNRKLAIEVKNRTNTDNDSSKKYNLKKNIQISPLYMLLLMKIQKKKQKIWNQNYLVMQFLKSFVVNIIYV